MQGRRKRLVHFRGERLHGRLNRRVTLLRRLLGRHPLPFLLDFLSRFPPADRLHVGGVGVRILLRLSLEVGQLRFRVHIPGGRRRRRFRLVGCGLRVQPAHRFEFALQPQPGFAFFSPLLQEFLNPRVRVPLVPRLRRRLLRVGSGRRCWFVARRPLGRRGRRDRSGHPQGLACGTLFLSPERRLVFRLDGGLKARRQRTRRGCARVARGCP